MDSFEKRNNAIASNGNFVNGKLAQIAITTRGSDWYFAVCAVMTISTLVFVGLGFRKHRTERIFHYITAGITMVAAVAYFTMGANLGFTPIPVEYVRASPKVSGANRAIFYVRYVDWVITTPLLLTDLLLTAGMPSSSILWVVLVDEVMIITGLIGALVESSYKWAYFTFGCAALAYIVYVLAFEARAHARTLGADISKVYLQCGALTAILWILYPIAWGVSEGGNLIAPDSEAIFYGILDLLAKPVFGAILLFGHRNIAPHRLGLRIRDASEDPAGKSSHHGEKHGHHNGVGANIGVGATTGTNGVHNNGVLDNSVHNNGLHSNGVTGTHGTGTSAIHGSPAAPGGIHGADHHTAVDLNPNTSSHATHGTTSTHV